MNLPKSKYKKVTIPESLRRLQQEFAHSISIPFKFLEGEEDYCLQKEKYSVEVVSLMVPRGELGGDDRLATYNQQYWFRLLTVMQEEYPLLERLLGISEFNIMVSEYLDRFPSHSPTLRDLSNCLSEFLKLSHRWNRPMIKECAQLEYIYIQVFDSGHLVPLEPSKIGVEQRETLLMNPLSMQPHWFLFEEHWNLVELRYLVKTGKEDKKIVQPREQHRYWAIFRGGKGSDVKELGPLQFRLLTILAQGIPLGKACAQMAGELNEEELEFLTQNIQQWFTHWVSLGWFTM